MTFEVEEVVDRGMHGSEFLQRLKASEARQQLLSSSEWLVRIFGPIVKPAAAFLAVSNVDSDLAPGFRTGRFFSYAASAMIMSTLACAGVRYPTLEWRRCRL